MKSKAANHIFLINVIFRIIYNQDLKHTHVIVCVSMCMRCAFPRIKNMTLWRFSSKGSES